jgi:hypothetical protein
MVKVACFVVPSESWTCTVKLGVVPAAVGVPESAPVEELIESQDGSPLRLHVYGVTPPLACTVSL